MTIEEQVSRLDELILEYDRSIGIPPPTYSDEVTSILNMSIDQLKRSSNEEIGFKTWMLSQYNFFVQKEKNKELVRRNWLQSFFNIEFGRILDQLKGYGLQEKRISAINSNDVLAKVDKLITKSSLRLDNLYYMNERIDCLVKCLYKIMEIRK